MPICGLSMSKRLDRIAPPERAHPTTRSSLDRKITTTPSQLTCGADLAPRAAAVPPRSLNVGTEASLPSNPNKRATVNSFCSFSGNKRLDRVAPPERAPPTTRGALEEQVKPASSQRAVVIGGADWTHTEAAPLRALTAEPAESLTAFDQNNRAFVKALKAGDLQQVRRFLDDGVDIERRGMWDNTPLLLACHYGHSEIALELLQRGASPSAVNERGCSALLYTCVESMVEVRMPFAVAIAE